MSDEFSESAVATKEKKPRNPGKWHVMRENSDGTWNHETPEGALTASGRREAMRQIDDANSGEGRLWAFRESEYQPKSRKVVDVVAKEVWE